MVPCHFGRVKGTSKTTPAGFPERRLNRLNQAEWPQNPTLQPQTAVLNAKETLALSHLVKSLGVLEGDMESSGIDLLPPFPNERRECFLSKSPTLIPLGGSPGFTDLCVQSLDDLAALHTGWAPRGPQTGFFLQAPVLAFRLREAPTP